MSEPVWEPEPEVDYTGPIPDGLTWGATQPYIVAHLAHLQDQIDALTNPDPPQEAP